MDDHVPLFLTTEHFTLQTARSAAFVELNGRLQLYLTALSSGIVALALAAQVSGVEGPFLSFALVILPTVYALGLMTLGRLHQVQAEALLYAQGMNRIRRYYVEVAPEIRPYLILPVTDEPHRTLTALRMGNERWTTGLVTRNAMVVVLNSVIAGVVAGLVASAFDAPTAVVVAASAAGGLASVLGLGTHEARMFDRQMRRANAAFPGEP